MSRLVFSINPGRSGSDYLFRLLSTARNATAFHEPKPEMAGRLLTAFPSERTPWLNRLIYPGIYAKKRQKVSAIRRVLKDLPEGHAYVETNHMFILSFHDVVVRHFHPVEVVLLRRYLPRVLKSFLELNMFTPGDRKTKFWTVSPNSPSAAVPALAPDEELDQVDRAIAYLIDVEARAQRFIHTNPHVPVYEVRLAHLNIRSCVQSLFENLQLEPTPKTWIVVGQPCNQQLEVKQSRISEEYCRERVLQYMDKCQAKGIQLPPLPHLRRVDGVDAGAEPAIVRRVSRPCEPCAN